MFNKPKYIVLLLILFGLAVFIISHFLTKQLLVHQLPKSEELNKMINEQVNEDGEPQKPKVQKSIVKLDPPPVIPEGTEVRQLQVRSKSW